MQGKTQTLPLIVLGLLLAAASVSHAQEQPEAVPDAAVEAPDDAVDAVFMKVNDDVITTGMFRVYYLERMRETGSPNTAQLRARATDELVKMRLLAEEAEKQGLAERPAVAAVLAVERDRILSRLAMQEYARSFQPPEAELERLYEERYADHPGKEFKVRHIVVPSRDEAERLIRQLDAGADFAALATSSSTGTTGPEGGDLGWVDVEQMVEPFAERVKALEKGAYTKEPVQTHLGWHVILLEDARSADPPTFEEIKPALAAELQRQATANHVAELARGAKLEFNEKYIQAKPGGAATPIAAEEPAVDAPAGEAAAP